MAAGLCAYGLLLCLLVWAESAREDAMIDSLPRALWYSVVTMTTVGYGDLYPVTPLGKVIGAAFLLVSTGLLALLIGLVVSMITGKLFPRLRLWRSRRSRWYVFASDNEASQALARRLKDGLVIVCGEDGGSHNGRLHIALSPQALFALPFAGKGERVLFAMGPDETANERIAEALRDAPVRVYCRSGGTGEGIPGNALLFNEHECAARLYWRSKPWSPRGEKIVLVGDGSYAMALLDQALLTAPPGCTVELYGDWMAWRELHRTLLEWPGLGADLRFPEGDWRAHPTALRDADRIVLCEDDRWVNRDRLEQLRRYYVTRGRLDALCEEGFRDAGCFGGPEELFTPELVMKQALNRCARQMHELYRSQVGDSVPPWEALSEFKRRSNQAVADHLLTKLRLLLPEEDVRELTPQACARAAKRFEAASPEQREAYRALEHDRWTLFHTLYNWRYAEKRDDAAREHPLLVPYDRLDAAERRKDDSAWELLRTLSDGGTL